MEGTANAVRLAGTLTEKQPLRYTPAGIPFFEGTFHYIGEVFEGGSMRKLEFDFTATAFSECALRLAGLAEGKAAELAGFLAPKSLRARRLTVHVTEFTE